jgi:hypothetical protein
MNLGFVVLLVSLLGYFSNWLNGRFLNNRITHFLYYIGAVVHETSHAVLCILTGAKITEFSVFSVQPHVTHRKSRLSFIGEALISFAPIAGGMFFLFLVNTYLLNGYFAVFAVSGWQDAIAMIPVFAVQFQPLAWQSWVMVLLLLNVGAMIGPSWQDLKNIWFVVLLLFFVQWPLLASWYWFAIGLILANIALQIVLIVFSGMVKLFARR